jgi:hypothetical protein
MENEQPILVNSKLERIDFDELVERCRNDANRILADDDVGIVVYVGDLDIHTITGVLRRLPHFQYTTHGVTRNQ